jgi:hypothetical protein
MRPEAFCYLLRDIARPCCAFWRSRCPPWSQGCSARPPIAAGVWYKHLDGGVPVLGARFGGLKSVKPGLLSAAQRRATRCRRVDEPTSARKLRVAPRASYAPLGRLPDRFCAGRSRSGWPKTQFHSTMRFFGLWCWCERDQGGFNS